MNIATRPKPTSLAERIAKVRNRMLVATLTKVPPTNKELFVALCKIYEEQSEENPTFSINPSDDEPSSLQELSFAHEVPENTGEQWAEHMLGRSLSPPLPPEPDDEDDEDDDENLDDFADWDKTR